MQKQKRQSKNASRLAYDSLETRKVLAAITAPDIDTSQDNLATDVTAIAANSGTNEIKQVDLGGPTLMAGATIQSAHVYYNNTQYAQGGTNAYLNAVDYYRLVARENTGSTQTLEFRNMTNAAKGINAMLFNFDQLASPSLTNSDFRFQWSPQGNFDAVAEANQPSNWTLVPFAPSEILVSPNTGTLSRVRVHWLDNQIENRWLRVTVFANQNTGLKQDEVFYIGHLAGDISIPVDGNRLSQPFGKFHVSNIPDVSFIRTRLGDSVFVSSTLDLNKNGYVEVDDVALIRSNLNHSLSNIQLSPPAPRPLSNLDSATASNSLSDDERALALWNSANTQLKSETTDDSQSQSCPDLGASVVNPVLSHPVLDQYFATPESSAGPTENLVSFQSHPASTRLSNQGSLNGTLASGILALSVNAD
jgi:hypothetical protein